MYKTISLAFGGVLTATLAYPASAPTGAEIRFAGTCQYFTTLENISHPCSGEVHNLRYIDGYDSFLFRAGSDTLLFIGNSWFNKKDDKSAENLGDDMTYMPLKQVVKNNREVNLPRGQCVLQFKTATSRNTADLIKVWCEYADQQKNGRAYDLDQITSAELHETRDYKTYGY